MTQSLIGLTEGRFKARAGALTLLYLASPVRRDLLLALLAEATTGVRVLEDFELPDPNAPIDLDVIADPYLVERADPDADPDAPIGWDTSLRASPAGHELLFVGRVLERWLRDCPDGALELGPEAGPALSALLGGWCSTVVHALAAKPLTDYEVADAVGTLDDEIVDQRIAELENAGLLESFVDERGEERFAPTEWLRRAIAPLAAAGRQEKRFPPGDTAPVAAIDVQASFLLTLPLLDLPARLSGSCSLAVELDEEVLPNPSGTTVRIEAGEVVAYGTSIDETADAWGTASAADWFDAVIERNATRVRTGGDRRLAGTLLQALHEALFGVQVG